MPESPIRPYPFGTDRHGTQKSPSLGPEGREGSDFPKRHGKTVDLGMYPTMTAASRIPQANTKTTKSTPTFQGSNVGIDMISKQWRLINSFQRLRTSGTSRYDSPILVESWEYTS